MLADLSPLAASVSAGRDRRSHSREIGESTGDRSHSRSSRSFPSRGRDSCEEHRCVCSRSPGSHDLSHKSPSHSTDRSQSRGRKHSRCEFH